MAFSIKIKGNHHLQGNVQVYNVRIPVLVGVFVVFLGSKLTQFRHVPRRPAMARRGVFGVSWVLKRNPVSTKRTTGMFGRKEAQLGKNRPKGKKQAAQKAEKSLRSPLSRHKACEALSIPQTLGAALVSAHSGVSVVSATRNTKVSQKFNGICHCAPILHTPFSRSSGLRDWVTRFLHVTSE